jgi:predicted DNA-binding transcriptional regulator
MFNNVIPWIGYTMATTIPPKPIEEITTESKQNKDDKPQAT